MSGRYEVRDNPNVQSVSGLRSTYQPGGGVLDYRDVGWHIITELNMLLDRAEKAETALDEAIARADKASNALIRTTAALRETTIRAEKAEARVAELERESESWSRVFKAKTAPQTPVPAPEGTETVQKAPPPSPVGAPRSDRGAEIKTDTENPGPVLGHPRGLESSNLDMAYPVDRRATTCEDVKCPCVEPAPRPTRPPPGICEVWERDGRYFGRYAAAGPAVELSVAQPDTGLVRVLVDPAAAAEVEARTGAVVTMSRDRTVEQRYADAPLRATVTWGPASPENMLTFTTPDVWIVTPPRAGLPSRDEVAAFLEARWPK